MKFRLLPQVQSDEQVNDKVLLHDDNYPSEFESKPEPQCEGQPCDTAGEKLLAAPDWKCRLCYSGKPKKQG